VSAMIDQKVKLAEEKTQLKRNCKEEKKKLESELERAQQKREAMEDQEHTSILAEIDQEYNAANDEVINQKKAIAEVNRAVTVLQRKIEACPSNVEVTQFHKRLVELFDNLNNRTTESRKYYNLFNTVQEVKTLFTTQIGYLKEID
jgi:chromosome segregation ATPase